jgi:hypothetical protein
VPRGKYPRTKEYNAKIAEAVKKAVNEIEEIE